MAEHNRLGKEGEDLAANYLLSKGYQILLRNWRNGKDEIDLIARKGGIIVLAEVKTRSEKVNDISELLGPEKETSLIRSANDYMQELDEELECRIDLLVVQKNGMTSSVIHYEDAIQQG